MDIQTDTIKTGRANPIPAEGRPDFLGEGAEANAAKPLSDAIVLLQYVDQKMDRASVKAVRVAIRYSLLGFVLFIGSYFLEHERLAHLFEQTFTERLNREFSTPNMISKIETAAKNATEGAAKPLIEAEIKKGINAHFDALSAETSKRIDTFKKETVARTTEIETEQHKVAKMIDSQRKALEGMTVASQLATAAINGSYSAYQKLASMTANRDASPLASLYINQINELLRSYSEPLPVNPLLLFPVSENGTSIDIRKLPPRRLVARLGESNLSPGYRGTIGSILYFEPSSELIDPAIEAFQSDDSIYVLATFYGHFARQFQNPIGFQDREGFLAALKDWKRKNGITK